MQNRAVQKAILFYMYTNTLPCQRSNLPPLLPPRSCFSSTYCPYPSSIQKKIKNREEIEQALEKSGVANYAAGVTDHEIAR